MDFRQRLEQSRSKPGSGEAPVETSDEIISPYFALERGQNPYCLDLRLSGALRKAFPYSYVAEITFDISAGIEILTAQKRIRIIGRNLAKLFDYLIQYRIRYIQANIGSDANEDGLFVKEIVVEDLAVD